MSKQPVAQQDGGEPPASRAGVGNAVPPSQPGTSRAGRKASERQDVQSALRDGAGTSAAMAAPGDRPRVTLVEPNLEGATHRAFEQPPAQDDGGRAGPRRPFYVPPSRPAVPPPGGALAPGTGSVQGGGATPPPSLKRPGGMKKDPRTWGPAEAALPAHGSAVEGGTEPPLGDRRFSSTKTIQRVSTLDKEEPRTEAPPGGSPPPHAARPQNPPPQYQQPSSGKKWTPPTWGPARAARPADGPAVGGGTAPPPGGSRLSSTKTIERVSTLDKEEPRTETEAPPGGIPPPHAARPQNLPPQYTPSSGKTWTRPAGQPQIRIRPESKKRKQPLAFCFTACCILFWLLVVCIGLAILVVYLIYHPKPPRLRVTGATLNAGYIDQLPPPHVGKALNSDLSVLAVIYNPNTKIDVVLRYMQLDLYFQGLLIGTQAVWPPLYQRPGDSDLRSVELVVSEVALSQEDAEVWKNATTNGEVVQLHLAGKFLVQLNFGRWLPFRYPVYPSCTLWLNPPPAGALRKVRCRQ